MPTFHIMDWTAPTLTCEPLEVLRNRVTGQAIRFHEYHVGRAQAPTMVLAGTWRSLNNPFTVMVLALTIRQERVSRTTATSTIMVAAMPPMAVRQTGPSAIATPMTTATTVASAMRNPVNHGVER